MDKEECKNCPLLKRLEELEKKIEKYENPVKHSGNSSLPPSSDQNRKPYPKREKSGKKPGGQPGHKGHTKNLYDNPDEIIEVYPEKCEHCGNYHFDRKENVLEQRQVVDIPEIKPYVTEYQQKAGICTHCGKRNVGIFPENITPNIQIGERAKALTGYLNVHGHMSNEKIEQFFEDILGFEISKGTVNNKINELAADLEPKYNEILENLRKSDVLGSDETTARINGKKSYLWIFQNLAYSFFTTSARNFKTIQDVIGEVFDGSWISDRFGAQLKVKAYHQLCLAHLTRECKYIIEAEESKWAKNLKDLFHRAMEFKRKKWENYNPKDIETFRSTQEFKSQLADLFREPPPKDLEKKLYKGLLGRQHQLLHFLEKKEVPPTNNDSERGLRNCVIHRRVIGGFRSDTGAKAHNVIASIIETAKKRGINIFHALSPAQQYLLTA
jgi:transposase